MSDRLAPINIAKRVLGICDALREKKTTGDVLAALEAAITEALASQREADARIADAEAKKHQRVGLGNIHGFADSRDGARWAAEQIATAIRGTP